MTEHDDTVPPQGDLGAERPSEPLAPPPVPMPPLGRQGYERAERPRDPLVPPVVTAPPAGELYPPSTTLQIIELTRVIGVVGLLVVGTVLFFALMVILRLTVL